MIVNRWLLGFLFCFLIWTVDGRADLKDKFEEQSQPKKSAIPQKVLDIETDINNTWNVLREKGSWYLIMDGTLEEPEQFKNGIRIDGVNFGFYNGVRFYKNYIKDVFPVVILDKNIFVPVQNQTNNATWKGNKISCRDRIRFARPTPLAKIQSDSTASFKMRYSNNLVVPEKLSARQDFEVNTQTNECYATGKTPGFSKVHKCHFVNFDVFMTGNSDGVKVRNTENVKNSIKSMFSQLYFNVGPYSGAFETCKVTK